LVKTPQVYPQTLYEAKMATNTEAGAPAGYVEIDLRLDLDFHLPYRAKDGTLGFKLFRPDEGYSLTKVLVPIEATTDNSSLRKYVRELMTDWDADFISIDKVDIWDGNDKEGKFRFDD
jgi:hypothetical protein